MVVTTNGRGYTLMTGKISKIFIFTFFALATYGQKRDTTYTYSICVAKKEKPGIAYEGKDIIIREEEKIPYISGIVTDLHFRERLPALVMLLKNDSIVKQIQADTNGVFSFNNLTPGKYDLKLFCVGYLTQKMTNISLTETEMHNLVFKLGDASGFVMMDIKSKKKLTQRQLNKATKKAMEEINQ